MNGDGEKSVDRRERGRRTAAVVGGRRMKEKVSEPSVSELVQHCIKRLTMHLGILVKPCRMRAGRNAAFNSLIAAPVPRKQG